MEKQPWPIPIPPTALDTADDNMGLSGSSFVGESSIISNRPKPPPCNQKRQRSSAEGGHPIPLSDPDFQENAQLSRASKRRMVADLLSLDLVAAMDITGSSPPTGGSTDSPLSSHAIPIAGPSRSIALPSHVHSGGIALGSPPIQSNQNLRKTALLRTLLKGQAQSNTIPTTSALEPNTNLKSAKERSLVVGMDRPMLEARGRLSISNTMSMIMERQGPGLQQQREKGSTSAMDVPNIPVDRGVSETFTAASYESNMTEDLSAIMGDCSSSDSDDEELEQRQRMPLPPVLPKNSIVIKESDAEAALRQQVDSMVANARAMQSRTRP